MAMSRLTYAVTNANWTAPAGITRVIITPCDASGNSNGNTPLPVTVSPGTTYTVTINSASFALNNPNTFGSLFSWTSSGYIKLGWVE